MSGQGNPPSDSQLMMQSANESQSTPKKRDVEPHYTSDFNAAGHRGRVALDCDILFVLVDW